MHLRRIDFLVVACLGLACFSLLLAAGLISGMLEDWRRLMHSRNLGRFSIEAVPNQFEVRMTLGESVVLEELAPLASPIVLVDPFPSELQWEDRRSLCQVEGVDVDGLAIHAQRVAHGRGFMPDDIRDNRRVMVAGVELLRALGIEDFSPQWIQLKGVPYQLVGILEEATFIKNGRNVLWRKNLACFIPYTSCIADFRRDGRIDAVRFSTPDPAEVPGLARLLVAAVERLGHTGHYRLETMEGPIAASALTERRYRWILGTIAMLILTVGTIISFNLGMASYYATLYEWGVIRALGARPGTILIAFLCRYGCVGGLSFAAGAGLFWALEPVLASILDMSLQVSPTYWSVAVVTTLAASFLAGLPAGIRTISTPPSVALAAPPP